MSVHSLRLIASIARQHLSRSGPKLSICSPSTKAGKVPCLPHELEAYRFYDSAYDLICAHLVRPGEREVLGRSDNRVCRFCGRNDATASFKDRAHAIPESLGNKSLFTTYECDKCNHLFGTTIENDLGAYTKPGRVFARIRGKRSVPSLKQHGAVERPWRIDVQDSEFHISEYEDDSLVDIVHEGNRIELVVTKDAYTPVAVVKAFVRIGLTLVPETELSNFRDALDWIMETDHGAQRGPRRVATTVTFQPGPMPNDVICAAVLRRKASVRNVPYAFLVLTFGNHQYQVCIPSETQDRHLFGADLEMPLLPTPFSVDPAEYGHSHSRPLELDGTTPVRGEQVRIALHYDSIESATPTG